ncbi:MAG TPA: hypothetical protein VHM19_05170, partial [Polyangiales bacterium]|nr:hypothetical protein [Polyangiales bacterium]
MKKTSWLCVLGCLSCLGAGCQAPPSQPRIAYQTGAAVGQWNVGAGGAGDVTGMGTGTGNGS